jgi:hypothetical protein
MQKQAICLSHLLHREIEPLLREIFDLNLPFQTTSFKHHAS